MRDPLLALVRFRVSKAEGRTVFGESIRGDSIEASFELWTAGEWERMARLLKACRPLEGYTLSTWGAYTRRDRVVEIQVRRGSALLCPMPMTHFLGKPASGELGSR